MRKLIWRLTLSQALVTIFAVLLTTGIGFYSVNRRFQNLSPAARRQLHQLHTQVGRIIGPRLGFGWDLHTALLVAITLTAVVSVLWGVAASFLIAKQAAKPLEEVAGAARRIASGQLSARVDTSGMAGEVARLAEDFNLMSQSLERLDSGRRQMVLDIAHELRTPLAALQARLDAIEDQVFPLDFEQVALLNRQSRLLQRLIEDLHTLSSSDAGQVSLQPEEVDGAALCQEVAERFAEVAARAGATLRVRASSTRPLLADPDRLAQILGNLVDNAVKYGKAGQVEIGLRWEGDSALLWVRDDGPGLSGSERERAFEPFYRSPGARQAANRGSGLGLAIVDRLVRLHGGAVDIASEPGQGATVTVRLPQKPALGGNPAQFREDAVRS